MHLRVNRESMSFCRRGNMKKEGLCQ